MSEDVLSLHSEVSPIQQTITVIPFVHPQDPPEVPGRDVDKRNMASHYLDRRKGLEEGQNATVTVLPKVLLFKVRILAVDVSVFRFENRISVIRFDTGAQTNFT